ncbi:MAG TPA: hypothetical protein VMR16_00395, partial [Candidatus Saccharimonadales bacterium]|nr:hypothetical protein [Candidatus Saccharimonadales bacterium]
GGDIASAGLADIVRADTAEAKTKGVIEGSGLEQVSNPDIKRNFETAFEGTEQLFARISLTTPTPEEFVSVGVDFVSLGEKFERMKSEDLEPILVITPNLPLTDGGPIRISSQDWVSLYSAMTRDTTIPNNPLNIQNDSEGLWINSDVRVSANDLLKQEEERVLYANDIHMVSHGASFKPGDVYWTVALLPTTDNPQGLNTPRADYEAVDDPKKSKLSTISQYLTLQAIRIQSGQSPVDTDTYSWLHGTFNGGTQAPYGDWSSGNGLVYVYWDDVGNQDDYMGVRLPVWQ